MDDQVRYYNAKLQYEIDPWDLNEALGRGDKIHLVDTRSPEAGQSGFDCHVLRRDSVQRIDRRRPQHGPAWVRVKELIGCIDCWRYDGYPVDGLEPVQPAGSCGCS
jgi:hypothetical protein